MRTAEILESVQEVARLHVGYTDRLKLSDRLAEDLDLDSIQILTLAVEVENRFQICLDIEDEGSIETVEQLIGAIRRAHDA